MRKTIVKWGLRLLALLIAPLPGACHFMWTAPALWAHQSSFAGQWFAGLWVLSITFFAVVPVLVWFMTAEKHE